MCIRDRSIDMLPTGEEAVSAYERDGGNLRSPEVFGTDILAGNRQLQQLRFDNLLTLVSRSFSIAL